MTKVEDAGQSNKELLDRDSFKQEEEPRDQQEHLYKVLVIGDFGVGESNITCLIVFITVRCALGTYPIFYKQRFAYLKPLKLVHKRNVWKGSYVELRN